MEPNVLILVGVGLAMAYLWKMGKGRSDEYLEQAEVRRKSVNQKMSSTALGKGYQRPVKATIDTSHASIDPKIITSRSDVVKPVVKESAGPYGTREQQRVEAGSATTFLTYGHGFSNLI